ncbi:hypothetical protein F4780DRAFT_205018 [Xylariomycetidae sp. FL0641]|nr:hypothetical protein F4780DRAFT_205018 [Xylariomycetidae sp. FL0641]
MNTQHLTQTLVESFNALADEVQNLSDRQTILEHKLRYAHEQFQYLADKYAPTASEISETLGNLQVPPGLHNPSLANTNFVPLPKRKSSDSKHQIAVIIREGRRVASSLSDLSKSTRSRSSRSRDAARSPTSVTTMSTVLEQDFTVPGRRGTLDCPFSQPKARAADQDDGCSQSGSPDALPHDDADPVCAKMQDETNSQHGATKCPIRYMDQHSPEEIAEYLERHKHELPRSHEVCVRRYQRNEEHIRKLDAKYGNLVNMVEGLGKIHQPMLPEQDTRPQSDVERGSNQRVENWAKAVSATADEDDHDHDPDADKDEQDRQGHFDRPLKEVRVGESPSRPWGISVPVYSDTPLSDGAPGDGLISPPPAPVHMPSGAHPNNATPGKCPFDHTKLAQMMRRSPAVKEEEGKSSIRVGDAPTAAGSHRHPQPPYTPGQHQPFTPAQPQTTPHPRATNPPPQPAFLNTPNPAQPKPGAAVPQMVFTGPVFIGYPVEQAIQVMQHYQAQQP